MAKVGVRELKNRVSEIIRAVREEQVEYVITYRGQPAARLIPIDDQDGGEQAWQELERLSQEISNRWQSNKSAMELLSEVRR